MRILTAVATAFVATALIAVASCSGTPAPVGLSAGCSINSDCEGALVCVFGRCHIACVTDKDCNGDAMCVVPGVCELPAETKCSSTLPCVTGLTCVGATCLASCSIAATVGGASLCLAGQSCVEVSGQQVCEPNPTDAGVDSGSHKNDGSVGADAPADSGHRHDATMPPPDAGVDSGHPHDAGHDGTMPTDAGKKDTGHEVDAGTPDSGHDAGNDAAKDAPREADSSTSCPNAQTEFGATGSGTINPHFTSGVGARNASQMFVFDGYYGPDPAGVDAGDSGGGNVALIWAQAFDVSTGSPQGPAQPLFVPPLGAGLSPAPTVGLRVYSSAVSPGGEIALLYEVDYNGGAGAALYAAFLQTAVDAGAAGSVYGLQLESVALLLGNGQPANSGQPYVIWSDAIQSFVMSWMSTNNGNSVSAASYSLAGSSTGIGFQLVPTNDNGVVSFGNGYGDMGSLGVSGGLYGVAYMDQLHSNPAITVYNEFDEVIGSPLAVVPAPRVGGNWVATAGTATGFVYLYDNQGNGGTAAGVTEAFLPVSPDAGIIGSFPDGGDGGGAQPFPTFDFPGGRAGTARAIADGKGGAGGVGVLLFYQQETAFAYVHADGIGYDGPTTAFPEGYGSDSDIISMTNFGGSFVLSLYASGAQQTVVIATGCPGGS